MDLATDAADDTRAPRVEVFFVGASPRANLRRNGPTSPDSLASPRCVSRFGSATNRDVSAACLAGRSTSGRSRCRSPGHPWSLGRRWLLQMMGRFRETSGRALPGKHGTARRRFQSRPRRNAGTRIPRAGSPSARASCGQLLCHLERLRGRCFGRAMAPSPVPEYCAAAVGSAPLPWRSGPALASCESGPVPVRPPPNHRASALLRRHLRHRGPAGPPQRAVRFLTTRPPSA